MVARVWVSRSMATPSLASTAWCRPSLQRRPVIKRPGVLIHDDDFVFLDDVLDVFLVKAIGLEQLRNGVDALRLGLEFLLQLGFGFKPFARVCFRPRVDLMQGGRQVRQHERVRDLSD